MLQRVSLSLLFLCLYVGAAAQDSTLQQQDSLPRKHYTRSVVWTAPVSKSTTINGVALSLMTVVDSYKDTLVVQGLNVEVAPLQAFFTMFAIAGGAINPFAKDEPGDTLHDTDSRGNELVKGLSLSAGGLMADMKGLGINGLMTMGKRTDGVQISGIINAYNVSNGVAIAGLCNATTTGKGLQIGLINMAKEGRFVQIGLINRIGKRIIPFFNCSLKKKTVRPIVATTR
ncbi:MAG: hypothetical protein J7623_28330 [Chitinophaga sp.]|uniref:hypothetical protein n=1 Tax=Chitinophaga sp. TaxID=1869181 RepID=UPI001B103346|nr:hypothetical protein [Chitinophaga sp.]MBO9732584.1 hypothetical protein [Chitinophaga sp.]